MTERRYATYPSLADQVVYVTGGANGIGRALVRAFAEQGSRVVFCDRDTVAAAATIASSTGPHTPVFHEVDLLDIAALRTSIDRVAAEIGPIDVLVNNAANDDRHTWDEMTVDYWDDRINTNLRHYFFAIQAAAPSMVERSHGAIVNIGSSSYMMQEDFFPGYAIAKSAVEGITRTMARTFGPHGIRMNSVLPGWVPTERQLDKWWTPDGEEQTMRDQALKYRIVPEQFVRMVLFLASDDGAGCTAQTYLVDGGRF